MNHHFFLPFTEWTTTSQKRNPEIEALIRIGLPAIPSLVRLRDKGPGNSLQRFYWRFWNRIPRSIQRKLTVPKTIDPAQWKMDLTELICMVILCHRDEPDASQFTRPLFQQGLRIAEKNDFRDGIHFNLLAATGVDDRTAEKYLLKQMKKKKVIFTFETGTAAASLREPSAEMYQVLESWLDRSIPENQRDIAFDALGYLSRKNADARDKLWQMFLEANPADQQYWRVGLGNGYYPKDLSVRMENTIHAWLKSTDPAKDALRQQWQNFYKYRDTLF